METSAPSPMYQQLTLFAADSPVSPIPLPGRNEERTITATSGRKCAALLRSSGPAGLCVRMCLTSSIWHSSGRRLSWKPSVTKSGRRLCFRLLLSERGISGDAPGLWPTPTAEDRYANGDSQLVRHTIPLNTIAKLFPTPRARDWKGGGIHGHGGYDLPTAIALLPTPTVSGNYNRAGASASSGDGLATAVGGTLNPMWVEWLMGFPAEWTALEDSATPLSRKSHSGSRKGSKR